MIWCSESSTSCCACERAASRTTSRSSSGARRSSIWRRISCSVQHEVETLTYRSHRPRASSSGEPLASGPAAASAGPVRWKSAILVGSMQNCSCASFSFFSRAFFSASVSLRAFFFSGLSGSAASDAGTAATSAVASAGCHGFFDALFLALASSTCRCLASASAVLSLTWDEATPLT